MSMQEILRPVQTWDAEHLRVCTALLFRAQGSSPRPPGSRLAANERGDMAGYISLGCVEGDVREHIRQILGGAPAKVVHYGLADELSLSVGLSCGGQIDVLLAPHDPSDPAWDALSRLGFREPVILLTQVSGSELGRQLLLRRDGSRIGSLGSESRDVRAVEAAKPVWEERGARLLEMGRPDDLVLAELLPPPLRLLIVGASPVAAALCKLAAAAGLEVVVVDPRREFANPQLFPAARQLILRWPEEGLKDAGAAPADFVAVLSHDAKLDLPGVAAALRAGCRYVGLLGGGKTQAARRIALQDQGFSESDLARLHGPIGLRIGSVTPDEIALSILAQIVAVSRGA